MKIGIDTSTITSNKAGVGYYIYSLVKALLEIDQTNEYILFTNNIENIQEFSIYSNAQFNEIPNEKAGFKWILKTSKIAREKCDIFLSPANFTFSITGENVVQIVHDLAPIRFPRFFPIKGAVSYRIQLELAMRRARTIITPLEAVRQELIQHFPGQVSKIKVIGGGIHDWTDTEKNMEELSLIKRKYALPEKYLLTVATLEPRKNHINMIKAFKNFTRTNPEFFYVIVGKKGWYFDEIFRTVNKLKLEDRVIFLGYVPEEDLKGIYFYASAFLFCSFYEGFGLPPLEAAKFKLPILCSDIDSLTELFGDVVDYADPNDTANIAKGMRNLVTKANVDYAEVFLKYTWENTAKSLLEIFENSPKSRF